MKKKKKPGYYTMLTLAILFVLGAVLTILPVSYAYKDCLLGYKAHCTFTPISTVACIIIAVLIYMVMNRNFTEAA
jgi:hypothetical protein